MNLFQMRSITILSWNLLVDTIIRWSNYSPFLVQRKCLVSCLHILNNLVNSTTTL